MKKALLVSLLLTLGGCATQSCDRDWNDQCRAERLLYQNDLMQAKILISIGDEDSYELAQALLDRSAKLDRRGETEFYQALLLIRQGPEPSEVLDLLELDIPVVGLAKREEELWRPHASSPVVLDRASPALRLLQRVRDETHRFATGLNQRLRSSVLRLEHLESVEGIGPARAKALINAFGSVEAIAAAEPAAIAEKGKIAIKLAELVKGKLNGA